MTYLLVLRVLHEKSTLCTFYLEVIILAVTSQPTDAGLSLGDEEWEAFFFLIVCFTSYFVFSIAVLPHSPGVVYSHLLLRQETRIIFVHREQKSYTPTAFGKLWTTLGLTCMKHALS